MKLKHFYPSLNSESFNLDPHVLNLINYSHSNDANLVAKYFGNFENQQPNPVETIQVSLFYFLLKGSHAEIGHELI